MSDLLNELQLKDRDEVVAFLKSLLAEEPLPCPLCCGELVHLHQKAKKSNGRWKCKNCEHVYRVSHIMKNLPE